MSEQEQLGTTTETFDPNKYLSRVGGKQYLEVKWRLVWFRQENPDGKIETELVFHDFDRADPFVVFKATVMDGKGGVATGYGSEEASDFGDYIEKAETKAIGRALAALGYGTQFCDDFIFDDGREKVVDSPIEGRGGQRRRASTPSLPPADEQGKWHCESCGTEIKAGANSRWTTEQLVSLSMRKYKKVLCYSCSQKQ